MLATAGTRPPGAARPPHALGSGPGPAMAATAQRSDFAAPPSLDAVVVADAARRVTSVTAEFERVTGRCPDEAIGRDLGELLRAFDTDPACVARLRTALDEGDTCRCELGHVRPDGSNGWIEVGVQPLRDAHGAITGYLCLQRDVTAAREAARALAVERQRLQRIIDGTQCGTWEHDLSTGVERLNPRYAEMLGYEVDELLALIRRSFLDLVHPDDAESVERARNAHLRGQANEYRVEFRMRHKAGHWVWLSSRGLVVERDAQGRPLVLAGIQLDISDRRRAEADGQRSADVLLSAIDAIDEAFVLYDPDDRLVLCNEKYRDVYRASAEAIVPGARFEDILRHGLRHGQYPAAAGREEAWLAERMAQHNSGQVELVQRLDDGRTVRIVERRTPDGHLVGFRVDITELVRATEAAERADRAKSEFIATISHELRTPLQSIIGFSELGQHFAAGHPRFEPMFDDILSGGRRMLTLVNALLDVSKIEAGDNALSTAPGDLWALAAAVAAELRPQFATRSLTVRMPQPLPSLPVRVNAFRLQQVLRNVLANATRFAPTHSCIEIEGGPAPAGGAWLSVRDHGPGIPEDELQSIFEPFVQSSRTRDGAGGTGLGLAICRKIMQAHGGRITAANAAGGGAVLTLWLPSPADTTARTPCRTPS